MTNEQTLADAITMIRILVAHGHEPLPRDLLARASNFLERFPYELPSKSDAEFLSLVGHCSNCSCQDCREFFKADARARVEPDWTDANGKRHRYKCGLNPDPHAVKHMVAHCTCSPVEPGCVVPGFTSTGAQRLHNSHPEMRPRVFRGNGPDCLECGKVIAEHLTGYYFCPAPNRGGD